MKYVCQGLGDVRVSNDAANCIRCVCEEFCFEEVFVQRYWNTLMQVYEQSFRLPIQDACEITQGLTLIACGLGSYDHTQRCLQSILDTPVKYLTEMIKTQAKDMRNQKEQIKVSLLDVLKRISVIWKFCSFSAQVPLHTKDEMDQVPLLSLFFRKLWPFFKIILQTYKVIMQKKIPKIMCTYIIYAYIYIYIKPKE
ncbi:hypothetical protein RFI_16779 [Reticulomyxa filosa]|uniref:Uncharacterized protein n=1 Tax=Reticulomyxa filosa TaxID=46433 RepID=X6N3X5_RETFI|nr:hypothetical protein RFI_16779 [Reticulomyxa filosa]|eukprot:ETO20439.1 hypothetical protein RFI_16779 [Reticulomyxa filosa]